MLGLGLSIWRATPGIGGGAETFSTWNSADKGTAVVLSNSDLDAASSAAAPWAQTGVRGTRGRSSGKYYFELVVVTMGATGGATDIYGVAKSTWPLATNFLGSAADSLGNRGSTESFQTGTGIALVGGAGFGATEVVGTVLMYALDIDAGKLWHGRNGTWRNSGDPGAGTGHSFTISAGTWYPAASIYDATTSKIRLRTKTADFSHSVPSGFSAWG